MLSLVSKSRSSHTNVLFFFQIFFVNLTVFIYSRNLYILPYTWFFFLFVLAVHKFKIFVCVNISEFVHLFFHRFILTIRFVFAIFSCKFILRTKNTPVSWAICSPTLQYLTFHGIALLLSLSELDYARWWTTVIIETRMSNFLARAKHSNVNNVGASS